MGNSTLWTLHLETNFLEMNFPNKLFVHILLIFLFVQTFFSWYLTISKKETSLSLTKAADIFVLNSVMVITKNQPQFYMFT